MRAKTSTSLSRRSLLLGAAPALGLATLPAQAKAPALDFAVIGDWGRRREPEIFENSGAQRGGDRQPLRHLGRRQFLRERRGQRCRFAMAELVRADLHRSRADDEVARHPGQSRLPGRRRRAACLFRHQPALVAAGPHQRLHSMLARQEFAQKSYALFLKEWSEHRHVHENYNAITGEGDDVRSSDRFYHWGALLGLIDYLENNRGAR